MIYQEPQDSRFTSREVIARTVAVARSTDIVYAKSGLALWPDSHDYRADGIQRLERSAAQDNGTKAYHQAVRAWKAPVEIVGNEGVPLFAAWAKARIDLLDPGAAIRPALSARPEAEGPAAWWSKSEPALIQIPEKSDFPLETVDVSALDQVPALHACSIPFSCLHYEKLAFTVRYLRTRCAYDELKRAVSGEFRSMRPMQSDGSLPNRSRVNVVPPQLPSGRWFAFRSCCLPATGTCRVSHRRIALRFARQSPLTRGHGVKIAGISTNGSRMKPTTGERL